jgi:hypothetical protein
MLKCATALLPEGGWRAANAALTLARNVVSQLTHSNMQLRMEVANALHLALDLLTEVPRDASDRPSLFAPVTPSPAYSIKHMHTHSPHSPFHIPLFVILFIFLIIALNYFGVCVIRQNEIMESVWNQLKQQEQKQKAKEEGSGGDHQPSPTFLWCSETIVNLVHIALSNNSNTVLLFLPRILPFLFNVSVEAKNEDVRQKAHRTLLLVAQSTLPQHFFQEPNHPFLTTLQTVAHSPNWKIRKAFLPFLQCVFSFSE